MKIFNTLSRQLEEFVPIESKKVGMYTCGPTVYDYVTIGNWRTYTLGDLLVRVFKYLGYETEYVMNITDVGHLTGDNEGDADTGIDRLEKGARREGKTAWQVAEFYTKDFLEGFGQLNLVKPMIFSKATDHIAEQIDLVKKIEEKGFAYKITDGIYFDTRAYEKAGNKYGELSNLEEIREGARVERNPEKRDARDFALWKFSPADTKRDMEWESPWGVGFPGWHIECSAMGMKYLGEQFDLHIGGEDLRSTHHPNEIAQSEAATSKKPFVKYWMHGAFLQVDGGRMGKSLGNAYTLTDVVERGYSPMDLRYFYLTGHYRKPINFTWESLQSASEARKKLVALVERYREAGQSGGQDKALVEEHKQEFLAAIENDMNMPQALAVMWEMLKSELSEFEKYNLVMNFDDVFGLELDRIEDDEVVPDEVLELVDKRNVLRDEKKYDEADKVRLEIEQLGYVVEDDGEKTKLTKK